MYLNLTINAVVPIFIEEIYAKIAHTLSNSDLLSNLIFMDHCFPSLSAYY